MTTKQASRKYDKAASKKVAKVMHEQKHGQLRSGSTGKKVTDRKQAVAIGLSEARRSGAKVPKRGSSRADEAQSGTTRKRSAAKRTQRSTAKRAAPKRATKRTTSKRSTRSRPSKRGAAADQASQRR